MVFDLWGDAIKPEIQIAQRLQAMLSEILVLANAAVPWQFLANTTKVPVTKVLDPEASTGNTESPQNTTGCLPQFHEPSQSKNQPKWGKT